MLGGETFQVPRAMQGLAQLQGFVYSLGQEETFIFPNSMALHLRHQFITPQRLQQEEQRVIAQSTYPSLGAAPALCPIG